MVGKVYVCPVVKDFDAVVVLAVPSIVQLPPFLLRDSVLLLAVQHAKSVEGGVLV
jgi:hypothetical protein